MKKEDIREFIFNCGKPISLEEFTWDEKGKVFSSSLDYLQITGNFKSCTFNIGNGCTVSSAIHCTFNSGSYCTFEGMHACTFSTGSSCTFNVGSENVFNTSSSCTFHVGSFCTFNTGDNCFIKALYGGTFNLGKDCTLDVTSLNTIKGGARTVIVRRKPFQVIQPEEGEVIKICPTNIPGYISKRNGESSFYMNKNGERVEHIIADEILSEVVKKKGNVYHVINYGEDVQSFLITDGRSFAHGSTLEEAKESLRYKVSDRSTDEYEEFDKDTSVSLSEAIKMYRVITGACEKGTRYFVEEVLKDKKDTYTVLEVARATRGQYGHEDFCNFFSIF